MSDELLHEPTAKEWAASPKWYVGECIKGCYGPRVMVKGAVSVCAARGVYVCTGCGYAYPLLCEPNPARMRKRKGRKPKKS